MEPVEPTTTPRRGSDLAVLLRLSLPIVLMQVGFQLMHFVDTSMVGHLSKEALTASGIAVVWMTATSMFAMGLVFGLDPVVTQAHGAGDRERLELAARRGVALALLSGLGLGLSWCATGPVLRLFGQDPAIAEQAQHYALVQVPSTFFFLVFTALRQVYQGQGILWPMVAATLLANLVNLVANYGLIHGHFGLPAWGLVGAGVATSVTRVAMLGFLLVFLRRVPQRVVHWFPRSRRAFSRAHLGEIVRHGAPVGLHMGLEVWAFGATTLMAARLGTTAAAGHLAVLNLISLTFMVPLGISAAATTRVGNLIGAREPRRAQHAAHTALALGGGIMGVSAVLFYVLRAQLPWLYTDEAEVAAAGAAILPIAAAFQVSDGLQVVGCGVLRGMGTTRPAAVFNLLAFWVLALPLGYWLAFHTDQGLRGLWWGLALALALVAIALLTWIRVKGPARGAPALSSASG